MSENGKEQRPEQNRNSSNKPKFNIYWIYGLIAVVFIGIQFIDFGADVKEITWQEFEKNMLSAHDVSKVIVINRDIAEVYIKEDKFNTGKYDQYRKKGISYGNSKSPQFSFTIGSVETFEKKMEEAQKDFDSKDVVPF